MWFSDMTFRIEWKLDESDGLVQESLLGDITLRDEKHRIEEHSIYLDSWLNALIRGAEAVGRISGAAKIDIPEEPQPLLIHHGGRGGVTLSFRGKDVRAKSVSELISELRSASESFLEKISELKDIGQNIMVNSIRMFVADRGSKQ
jgi:hypothetical protein